MNTSAILQGNVEQELRWDPRVQAEQVGVTVHGDVVQLNGQVNSLWEKWAAEDAALRVKNVKAVANEIKVAWPAAENCPDGDVAQAAVHQLEWNRSIPDNIKVKVSNGWITIEGTVEAQYQKSETERALRCLKGVKGIDNEIMVKPKVSGSVVKTSISDAFKRSAAIDASHIDVETSEGRVILRGHVRTWAERAEAERTAWCAPGVTNVDDLLTIAWD
jgi:osmotically-inducible protein OsmY